MKPQKRRKKEDIPEEPEEDPHRFSKPEISKEVQQLLKKSILTPDYDTKPTEQIILKSQRQSKKARKEQRKQTAGKDWFDMPLAEMTKEKKDMLNVLQMRKNLDTTAFYRKNDRSVLPKYFQVGKIVETKADYYSGRLTKKERKLTLADEILSDYKTLERTKKRYNEIRTRDAKRSKSVGGRKMTMSKTKKRAINKSKS